MSMASKPIKARYLIIGGVAASLIPNLFSDNVFFMVMGVVGNICLLIGIVNGIVSLFKKKPTEPKQ